MAIFQYSHFAEIVIYDGSWCKFYEWFEVGDHFKVEEDQRFAIDANYGQIPNNSRIVEIYPADKY